MAKNTGHNSRTGSVKDRTQVGHPKTGDWVKRDETKASSHKGEFMGVKKDGEPFKGVAKEPENRRSRS